MKLKTKEVNKHEPALLNAYKSQEEVKKLFLDPTSIEKSSIDTVIFSSEGNAVSFGELGRVKHQFGATSDSHGGLGGF